MSEKRLIGISLFPVERMKKEEIERLPEIKAYQTGEKVEELYSYIDLAVVEIVLEELLRADESIPTTIFLALGVVSRRSRRGGV